MGSFKIRTGQLDIGSLLKRNLKVCSSTPDDLTKVLTVNLRHIAETLSQHLLIGSDERRRYKITDLVGDHHKITGFVIIIHTAGSIGQKQDPGPHHLHETGGKNYILHGISFIVVDTSLHDYDRDISYVSKDKSALMSADCGHRKTLNIMIIQNSFYPNGICIITESGSQHQCHLWLKINFVFKALIAF